MKNILHIQLLFCLLPPAGQTLVGVNQELHRAVGMGALNVRGCTEGDTGL